MFDGEDVIGIYDGNTMEKTFLTPFLDENLLMEIDGDSGALYFYFHDCLGSVVNVARFYKDGETWTWDDDKTNRYVYYAFGAKRGGYYDTDGDNTATDESHKKWDTLEPIDVKETWEPVNQDFEYTGRRFDDESGLMEYRARTYDPILGRFLQLDPIGLKGGLNRYRYVSNPIKWIDPLGRGQTIKIAAIKYKDGIISPPTKEGEEPVRDANDTLRENSTGVYDAKAHNAEEFYDAIKNKYDTCIENLKKDKPKMTEGELHCECCIEKLVRDGHSTAGLGGEEDFEDLGDEKREKIIEMLCEGATFIELGCFAFNTTLFDMYPIHLEYARLLVKKGGTYEGYRSSTYYGEFPEKLSSLKSEKETTKLKIVKDEPESHTKKNIELIEEGKDPIEWKKESTESEK